MSLSPATAAARRPSLLRSIPFWILLVGSLASAVAGIWIILDKISTMTTTLTNGSATGVEVYAGQSWVILGGALLAAGLFGLLIVLALAVVRSFVPAPAVAAVEVIEWTDETGTPADLGLAQEPVVEAAVTEAPVAAVEAAEAPAEQPASTPAH